MHHVTDMPSNVTLAAEQVAGIVKADILAEQRVASLKPGESLGPDARLTSTSGNAQLHVQLYAHKQSRHTLQGVAGWMFLRDCL